MKDDSQDQSDFGPQTDISKTSSNLNISYTK